MHGAGRTTLWAFCLLFLNHAVSGRTITEDEVKDFGEEYFDYKIRENPWFATGLGLDKYQDKIEEWNHEAFNRRIQESQTMLSKVNSMLDGNEFESPRDKVSLKIMQNSLEVFLRGAPFRRFTVTLNADLSGLKSKLNRYPVTTIEKLDNWYKRVKAYQSLFDDQIPLMDEAISSGLTKAKYNVLDWITDLRDSISDSTDNFFAFQPWKDLNVMESNRTFYDEAREQCGTLRDKMIVYTDKMENEYLPKARNETHEGVSYLPGGAEFYRNTLKYYTDDAMTPELAHAIGVNETKRITDEMKKIVAAAGFEGSVREYTDHLLSQQGETFPTSEELLQGYETLLKTRIEPKMSREFDPTDTGIGCSILDDPYGSIGRYMNPKWNETANDYDNGVFVYDGSKPEEKLKLGMLPLLLHEVVPGHHYQISYNLKVAPLPDYLRFYDFAHYAQDGFKFPTFTPFVEGWGLYAEYLGGAGLMDVIQTDKERLGQLSFESLRAARLVVDTGMHFFNWTRSRAEQFLKDSTTMSDGDCVTQIKRYIRWPGQACAYKIGELKLKELRQKAMDRLGESFDPKEFHNVILTLGPSPLELVESAVNEWLDDKPIVSNACRIVSTNLIISYTIAVVMAAIV